MRSLTSRADVTVKIGDEQRGVEWSGEATTNPTICEGIVFDMDLPVQQIFWPFVELTITTQRQSLTYSQWLIYFVEQTQKTKELKAEIGLEAIEIKKEKEEFQSIKKYYLKHSSNYFNIIKESKYKGLLEEISSSIIR